jgi:CTP synthase (UTP-ammonia lyase)
LNINVTPGTIAHRIYEKLVVEESYSCNFELNPLYESSITVNGLTVSGRGDDGEARILELTGHPFFFATLFRPQLASSEERPHPLVTAYLSAALKAKTANAAVG